MIYTGRKIGLRPISMDDCTETYVDWLNDPEVNRYLETRHETQTLYSVMPFVGNARASSNDYLFAILAGPTHIGNIKIGPINRLHQTADISYFIGSREHWGKGMATDAIRGATAYAFDRLGVYTLRAGVYGRNIASRRALEKNGYRLRGVLPLELVGVDGRDDHVYYSITKPEYKP